MHFSFQQQIPHLTSSEKKVYIFVKINFTNYSIKYKIQSLLNLVNVKKKKLLGTGNCVLLHLK